MSPAALTLPAPAPGVRFTKSFPGFHRLGEAGQCLWEFLWEATRFGTEAVRLTDREIADACGRGIRWVQKALRQLLDFSEDGASPTPVIDRFFRYGPRRVAGRVIQIVVRFAEPRKADAGSPPKPARSTPKHGTANPAPKPAPAVPAAAAVAAPEPEATPEEVAAAERFLEESRRRREAAARASAAAADAEERRRSRPPMTQEQLLEQIRAHARLRAAGGQGETEGGAPHQPSGP